MSYFELMDLLESMHIDRRSTIYYKLLGKDLNSRLVLFDTDKEILNMFEVYKESKHVDMYVIGVQVVDSPPGMLEYGDYAPSAPIDAWVPPPEEVHMEDEDSEDEDYNPVALEADSDDEDEEDIDYEGSSDHDNYLAYDKENPMLEVGMKFASP